MTTPSGNDLNVNGTSSGILSLTALYLEQKTRRERAWTNVDEEMDHYMLQLLNMSVDQFKMTSRYVFGSMKIVPLPDKARGAFRQSAQRWHEHCPMMKVLGPCDNVLEIHLSRKVIDCPEGDKYHQVNSHLIKIRNAHMEPLEILFKDVQQLLEEHHEEIKANPRSLLCVAARQTEKWIWLGGMESAAWFREEFWDRFPFVSSFVVSFERRLATKFRKVAYLTFGFALE